MLMSANTIADAIRKKIIGDIKEHGQTVIGVMGDAKPSFAYSIGLTTQFNLEFLCIGLDPKYATSMVNHIAKEMRDGVELLLGIGDDRWANMETLFMEADDRAHDYVFQADGFYGKKVRVVQIVMPDKAGILPNQPGYNHAYMDKFQPLLFPLT